jgi:hypothetical protein
MDVFGGLLDGPRARGAFALRVIMDPPWSVRIEDRAPLSLVSVVSGQAWVIPEDDVPVRLGAGSVAIIRGPDPYRFADDPATPAQVVIHPGQHCTTPDGQDLAQAMDLGVRSWGNSPTGTTSMLIGTYERHSEIGRQLLSVLPHLVVMPADAWDSPLLPMLGQEIVKDELGQEAVLDRLLDLLLVTSLRAWFSGHQARHPGGTAPRVMRWWAGPSGCCRTTPRSRGPSPAWPARPACRAPRWPAGSPAWSASRRCPSLPAGGWRWPLICSASLVPRSARSPSRSATAARSRSVPHSSASGA